MKKKRNAIKGFTLIEVLVSLVILFIAICMVTLSFKSIISSSNKQKEYENLFITVLSLIDEVKSNYIPHKDKEIVIGKMNGLEYRIKFNKVKSLYNWASNSNLRVFRVNLYRCKIYIKDRIFEFYFVTYVKRRNM